MPAAMPMSTWGHNEEVRMVTTTQQSKGLVQKLSLIHISEPTRQLTQSRIPSSA